MVSKRTEYTDEFILPFTSISISPFLKDLKKEMANKGKKLKFVPRDRYCSQNLQKYVDDDCIIDRHLKHKPDTDLTFLLNKYNIKSPRRFVFPQIVYDHKYPKLCRNFPPTGSGSPNYKEYMDDLHRYLDFFDELYQSGYKGTPINNQGGSLHRQVVYKVAKGHGIMSMRYSFNPLPGRRSVRNTIDMYFPDLSRALENSLSKNEKKQAKRYLESIRKNEPEFGSETSSSTEYVSKLRNKLQKILLFKGESINRISWLIYRSLLTKLSKKYQSRYNLSESNAIDLINSIDYIFFPLQYYCESRVTLRSAPFFDQASLVEYLSRNVPGTTELLVKDHPRRAGSLPNQSAQEISRFSNFAPPSISAHKIIRNASAVITLNNTVGHEALLWGKPVVTLGDALYSETKLTTDVHDIDKLDVKISEAIDEGGPTEKEILRYINGLYRVSDPIVWGNRDDENVSNIVKSICKRNPN